MMVMYDMCKKSKPNKMIKKGLLLKRIHTNLMGHLQCISNASKMIKPLNLGCPYSLLIMIV